MAFEQVVILFCDNYFFEWICKTFWFLKNFQEGIQVMSSAVQSQCHFKIETAKICQSRDIIFKFKA